MDCREELFFEIEGVFYTYSKGTLLGYAYTCGDNWHIITSDGEELYLGTIYLDRDKRVIAPRNIYQKKWASKQIDSLLEEYLLKGEELSSNILFLKLDTFRMKLFMIESYIIEYKSLKYTYFSGNALKFILF